MTISVELVGVDQPRPTYSVIHSRHFLSEAGLRLPPYELVRRAGKAVADLALAIAPHKDIIWVACGPGLVGACALEATHILKEAGKSPTATLTGDSISPSSDNRIAYQRARDSGVEIRSGPLTDTHLYIDGLAGAELEEIQRDLEIKRCIRALNTNPWNAISIDFPSGLNASTGQSNGECVKAQHTLSLLTIKPGLYMANGRDVAGTVWLTNLGLDLSNLMGIPAQSPTARMLNAGPKRRRSQNSHKGTFGDVVIVGGARGMTGAAILAGTAALHAGSGRVFVCLLGQEPISLDQNQPELMFKRFDSMQLAGQTVVCGCGGGKEISVVLPTLLQASVPLVIDADAINAIASDNNLSRWLEQRADLGHQTVITPHPLEAARLLKSTASIIQSDRIQAALRIAHKYKCVTVLKGAGTVIATPDEDPLICPTGNARLATAGTGDVLAGMIGANLAHGLSAHEAAGQAVFRHGKAADDWEPTSILTAHKLANSSHISAFTP